MPLAIRFNTEAAVGAMTKLPTVLLLNVAVPDVPLPTVSVPPLSGKDAPTQRPAGGRQAECTVTERVRRRACCCRC